MKNFKDSGIEWLGEIPQHWEIKPLKAVFNQRNEQNTNLKLHTILSLIKDIGVVPYEEKGNIGNKSKEDLQSYKIARINDLVLNKMNAVIGSLGVSAYNGLVSPIYLVFYINSPKYLMSYYSYLFQIKNVQKFLKIYAYGIMEIRESIDYLDFKKMSLPVPPLKEQEQIANFLDEKCEQIKNFIEKKEKLISLLKEQKQALINETITKGLDKNVNFKDSGIEWLGEIPQHWEIKKLKMLFILGNGLNITKADFVSYGIPCVSYGEIHSKYPCRLNATIHTLPFVSKTHLADKPQSLLQKGDFVFADTSEDIEGSGNFTSIQSDTPIFAGYHTITLKSKGKINSLYFSFLFDSIFTRNQIRKEVCGVKVFSITKSILKEVQCLIPSLKEQEQIANFLDKKCGKIDLLIEKTEKQIKLIKEYKTTLINQAVCGRIGKG
ncbi:restriction endonuclease subunit S [Campylobacter lari]|uniref:restriction endonuclease subunit S n=1 Tax=Campylobacter lari TaxID=201 RepID=UPI00127A1577|nr:restriction endonuclease subunit S [Campylobacter lari]EAI5464647.1 restriction endonuclease subunit S [Campylobacter lari]EAJ1108737.1 restriction endonuclease subunit S [Campylobacter lari]EAJ6191574.1 restriction endonuclease subunit S [Campylobacter lari]EAK0493624.1 restriction endonuclease subunit S [Campylobacter lari]EGK7500899.1 restriction endonuclease subunit S [Campylobacter lari]